MVARKHLEQRDKWQDESAVRGGSAENLFHHIMTRHAFRWPNIRVDKYPAEMSGIYGVYPSGRPHGIRSDSMIRNSRTGRAIFVEIKRQRAAGNAQERACKYFSPGIVASGQKLAKQPLDTLPFWWVFTDGIAEDNRYIREITHWFQGVEPHVLFWHPFTDATLMDHFERHILPLVGDDR